MFSRDKFPFYDMEMSDYKKQRHFGVLSFLLDGLKKSVSEPNAVRKSNKFAMDFKNGGIFVLFAIWSLYFTRNSTVCVCFKTEYAAG